MPIVQQGSVNTTALVVPDLYVQIVSPQITLLNGVPSDIVGVVGTATWGPLNLPVILGGMQDYARSFGAIQARKYDMGTQVATAVLQGAQNFRGVRVSDGTDVAAAGTLVATCLTLTALYTGTYGNGITVALSKAANTAAWNATVSVPGRTPEMFTNITGSGNAFWVNLAAAINSGQGALRGPSQLVVASAGVGTTTPTAVSVTLSTGTDGVATITSTVLVGTDGLTRTGMYALRGQGCSIGVLADADDTTQWTTQASFGLSEGIYMILVVAAGTAISNGTTGSVDIKATAGLDSYAAKLLHGDWIWWQDPVNKSLRLVSPQGFAAGRLANLSPEQSGLNKPIYGIAGSQKSGLPGSAQGTAYSAAEMSALFTAGIDVISNPQPGGAYWGLRLGHNSSSNAATNGDNYTRLTNYIAATLDAGMGVYVGQTITETLFRNITSTLTAFFQAMLGQGILGADASGNVPFSVICADSNNPASRTALNYVQADCQVRYMGINEKFIVNLEGGETVQVLRQTTPSGQALAA